MARFKLLLDTAKQTIVPYTVTARVLDGESCIIEAKVTENGIPYDFTGKSVRFECAKPNGGVIIDTDVSVSGSTITYAMPRAALAADGSIRCAYFRILKGSLFYDSTETFVVDVQAGVGDKVPHHYITELEAVLAVTKQQNSAFAEAEAQRVSNESARVVAEKARVAAEKRREQAESERKSAELRRRASERERQDAEALRRANEEARIAHERARRATYARIEQLCAAMCGEIERLRAALDVVASLHDDHDLMLVGRTLHARPSIIEMVDGELVVHGRLAGSGLQVETSGGLYARYDDRELVLSGHTLRAAPSIIEWLDGNLTANGTHREQCIEVSGTLSKEE